MEINKIYCGNSLDVLKTFPSESVNMIMTSPPYWNLRNYNVENQLGLESKFKDYINNLCDIFDEVKRVLRKDGTCWVNMGDTYYGSGKSKKNGSDKINIIGEETKNTKWKRPSRDNIESMSVIKKCLHCNKEFEGKPSSQFCSRECLNKTSNEFRKQNRELIDRCLVQIPSRFAIEMCNRGWILRNEIIWHKPNCIPSSAPSRFTVDFEKIFFFTKSTRINLWNHKQTNEFVYTQPDFFKELNKDYYIKTDEDGIQKKVSFWRSLEYYFNQQFEPLKEISIKRAKYKWCKNETRASEYAKLNGCNADRKIPINPKGRNKRCVWAITTKRAKTNHFATYPEDLCITPIKAGCPENGIVLDPFAGSGTTCVAAKKLNRKYIGIDLNKDYCEAAEKRISNILFANIKENINDKSVSENIPPRQ